MSLFKVASSNGSSSSSQDVTDIGVRRYLSESGEKEALRVLQGQLRHQKRVTSDDVRRAVRNVASKGGTIPIPPDFPPSRWVLEFKRLHGFEQLNSFMFDAASTIGARAALKQREMEPLCLASATGGSKREGAASFDNSNISSEISSTKETQDTSVASRSDDETEKQPSEESPRSMLSMLSKTAVTYSGPPPPFNNEARRQVRLQQSYSQHYRQQMLQQQRRATIIDGRRRAVALPMSANESASKLDNMRLSPRCDSRNSEICTSAGLSLRSSRDGSNFRHGVVMDISGMLPHAQQDTSSNGSCTDEMLDLASNASSYNEKRGYKLSHTVPAETWEKAITAVEQQGMSLRAAAKMYGVHFAALHRRVKKRAQDGQTNWNDGYFNSSDEAGIMRVVVAHAELGVLMTFDELMRLVEAAALRKLPDISVDSARKLLTRFQSRNAQSIRHLIEDWPPPLPTLAASPNERARRQCQPYLEHPGFSFGFHPSPIDRSASVGTTTGPSQHAQNRRYLFRPVAYRYVLLQVLPSSLPLDPLSHSPGMTDFIAKEQAAYPDIAHRYQRLQDLHARKLYHELTGELEAFVRDPVCHKYPLNLARLYQEFIRSFQDKLNPIRLVVICTEISTQFADPAQAQEFMEQLLGQLNTKTAHEAILLCKMLIAQLKFRRGAEFLAEVKATVDEDKQEIESLVGAEPVVHAAYYRVACDYYGALGPADKFYKNALMFLAYTQYDEMRPDERFNLAVNISIAALTGDNVFNFGEVLATPILRALENTDKQWLSDLLHAFNKGDIDRFNEIVGQNSKEFYAQPALVTKQEYVKEKVALLALMVLVFQRPSHERNIPFHEIALATRLPQQQVEWLVMRALSCQLIKGSIDQVDEIVRVTWVQPRVLDNSQLEELVTRLDGWEKKVNSTLLYVEEQTPELFQ